VKQGQCVLIAEDNEADVLTLTRAFKQLKIPARLRIVENGADVIAYLQGDGVFEDRARYPFPDLLLLDLKMPGTNGFDVLQWVRQQDDETARLCVIVLTTSDAITDINRAYILGANSFLTKPLEFAEFKQCIDATMRYWLSLNRAPGIPRQAPQCRVRV
jgi:CheY-like chemotaxis protein